MKRAALGLIAAASAQGAAIVDEISDVQYWVGSGENQAVVIVDWQDSKTLPVDPLGQALVWGYRWPTGETRQGIDALVAIDAADPRLEFKFLPFGGFGQLLFGAYYDLDGDGGTPTFNTTAETGSASDADDHFREGYRINGFWGYLNGATAGPNLPSWNESGTGAAQRTLSDGSWDGWVFSEDLVDFSIPNPAIAAAAVAVPEPTLVPIALGLFLGISRWRMR
jgi:hypothetical protein